MPICLKDKKIEVRILKENGWKRILAALLCLALCLPVLPDFPAATTVAYAVGNYGRVTKDKVRVRTEPAGAVWHDEKLDTGYVVTVKGQTTRGADTWYEVEYDVAVNNRTIHRKGYIVGSCLTPLTAEEAAVWEAKPVQPGGAIAGQMNNGAKPAVPQVTAVPNGNNAPAMGTGTITNGGVNLRERADLKSPSLMKLNRGDTVTVLSAPPAIGEQYFYQVSYNGYTGYIQSLYLRVNGVAPNVQPTAAPNNNNNSTSPTGRYVKLMLSSANLRVGADGRKAAEWLPADGNLPIVGAEVKKSGYTWYPVLYKGNTYYVRGDTVQVVGSNGATAVPQVPSVPNQPQVTPVPQNNGGSANVSVRLILTSANLRDAADGNKVGEWTKTGEVRAVIGASVQKAGYVWYPISDNGKTVYVRGDCVQLVQNAGTGQNNQNQNQNPNPTLAPNVIGYVKTVKNSVNLRLQPDGEFIRQVDINVVLPQVGNSVQKGGYAWFYVQIDGVRGYLRGDCVLVTDASGNQIGGASPQVTAQPQQNLGSVKLVKDKVNLRNRPAGKSLAQLPIGTVLPQIGPVVKAGAYNWYPVRTADGTTGYVRSDCVQATNAGGTVNPNPSQPTAQPSMYGYFLVTQIKVNVRNRPGGNKIGQTDKGVLLPMTAATTRQGGYTWYPVLVNGKAGYIRGDCGYQLSDAQVQDYLNTGKIPDPKAPAVPQAPKGRYVITTMDKVHLRAAASKDASAPYMVGINTVLSYTSERTVGGRKWYAVVYNNQNLWILGSTVRVMTDAEYDAYIRNNPQATPQPEVVTGYVTTIVSGVNLRKTPGGDAIARINKGVVMPYLRKPTVIKNATWYYVRSTSGMGYVRGDTVRVTDAGGNQQPQPDGGNNSNTGKPEATYRTLRRGSTGSEVKALVTELKKQGYYNGTITSKYTTAVEAAVRAFQSRKGLTQDGVAGPATQHALFGTVPAGTTDTSKLSMAIYPAEKIDWYTGGIQELIPKGSNFKVYDIKTGIVWWAHRWSGGRHADIETLTAADSARLAKAYGVTTMQQVKDRNMWQRRPSLITVGNRTFACSLYGIQHNPAGDTIKNNNMNGQVCLHFTNSRTHGSNRVDTYHIQAIEYALSHAPNGRK